MRAYNGHYQLQKPFFWAFDNGWDCELFHLVSFWGSCRLLLHVSTFELRCKSYKRSKWRFFFMIFKWSHRLNQLFELQSIAWCASFKHIVQSHRNICYFDSLAIPFKSRCLHKTNVHLRLAFGAKTLMIFKSLGHFKIIAKCTLLTLEWYRARNLGRIYYRKDTWYNEIRLFA